MSLLAYTIGVGVLIASMLRRVKYFIISSMSSLEFNGRFDVEGVHERVSSLCFYCRLNDVSVFPLWRYVGSQLLENSLKRDRRMSQLLSSDIVYHWRYRYPADQLHYLS